MIVPKRFVSICARKSDIGVSSTDERLPYPALLITTSSEPKAPIAAFTALAAADSSVTSSAKSLIWSPWRSDRSCRDSMSLAVAKPLVPAARPASTIARPRPRELPVTNQTCAMHLPISSRIIGNLLNERWDTHRNYGRMLHGHLRLGHIVMPGCSTFLTKNLTN